jgi:hypothetical protein
MQKIVLRSLLLIVVGFIVFTAGTYAIFYRAVWKSERRFRDDAEQLAPFLNADPAYGQLIPVNFPVLGYSLSGPVETQDDIDRLRLEVVRVFGDERAPHIMADVWVEPKSKAKELPTEQPK